MKSESDNGQAWLAYGKSLQKKGKLDEALQAQHKAAGFGETKPRAMYDLAVTHALKGESDKAFDWLERLKKSGDFNLSDVGLDAGKAYVYSGKDGSVLLSFDELHEKEGFGRGGRRRGRRRRLGYLRVRLGE